MMWLQINQLSGEVEMAKQRTNVMADDAMIVGYMFVLCMILMFLGMSMA